MSYCINPSCPQRNDPANVNLHFCRNCGSDLLLQGRYQVMRLLSDSSGFGKVYEAYQGTIPKILKVLKTKHNNNSRVVELFQQEAAVLSQLNHPGIPKVSTDGYFQFTGKNYSEPVHCLIMEKIDGLDLKQWMKQQNYQPISEKQALNWLKQLAEILHLVHQQNYFHRDIKPANIMIRSTGQLVLIDFGTARELTYTYLAELAGGAGNVTKISSAGYTPPEQEKGHAVPQSDFYALGRTFVYLLTGKQATDRTMYEPLTDYCNWRESAPHISAFLADFIDKLMAPTASARHKTTQELLDELEILRQEVNPPKVADKVNRKPINTFSNYLKYTHKLKAKNQWIVGSIVALIMVLGGYGTWQYQQLLTNNITTHQTIPIAKTINGHNSFINYLLISPDGQTLASASADKTIKLWNLATGQEIRTLRGHTSFVNYLVISPDGQTLASASADKTIKLWNITTGKEIRTLTNHTSFVNYLAISRDGQILVSASADKTIKLWNLATGKEVRTISGHSNYIDYFAISSDWQTIATGSADNKIKIWNLITGKEIYTLVGHSNKVNYVAISPDGQTLASASTDKTIKLWSLATGQEIRTLKGHSSFVNYLSISADGQTLVSASTDKTIKIWNLATGQEIYTLTGHSKAIDRFAISSDGQTIATGSGDSKISIWRLPK
ncbi:MAG: serine/threonine-protein kinase [Coleofasciculaceae cyanobacterium]